MTERWRRRWQPSRERERDQGKTEASRCVVWEVRSETKRIRQREADREELKWGKKKKRVTG